MTGKAFVTENRCYTSFSGAVLETAVTRGQGLRVEKLWRPRAKPVLAAPWPSPVCSALRNETVLHQFCCPAADTEQKPACSDLAPHRWEVIGGWSSPFPTPQSQARKPLPFGLFLLRLVFLFVCFHLLSLTSISLSFLWTPDERFPTFKVIMPFCSNPKSMLLPSKRPI